MIATKTGTLTEDSREEAPYSPHYIFRPERGVSAVLAFDEDGSGFEAFGVVPLASRDAEAHAVGSGVVGRSAGGDEAYSGEKSDCDEVVFVRK